MGRKVLLGWELGEGLGHTTRLAEAGRALVAAGWEVQFIVQDPDSLARVEPKFSGLPTPRYPRAITDTKNFRARSYGDILAGIGFCNADMLLPVVQSWLELLDHYRPDVVISDYSPILCLAAYGRVPMVTIGDGFVLPPGESNLFPKMRKGASGLPDENAILSVVRQVQTKLSHPQPPSVPRLTSGNSQILTVVEELDIYARYRRMELRAPYGLTQMSGRPKNERPSYFVYLTVYSQATRKILQTLIDQRHPFEVFLRDADAGLKDRVSRAGGVVHDRPPPLETMLQRHHAIIHHGGIGTSQTALAMGRPQILVPRHFEQTMTAARLEALQVGVWIRAPYRLTDIGVVLGTLMQSRLPAEASRRAKSIASRNYPSFRQTTVTQVSRLTSTLAL